MASLYYPNTEEHYYLKFFETFFGPLGPQYTYDLQEIPFNGKIKYFKQNKGMYGENEVRHSKVLGDITYHPVVEWSLPQPTTQYPRKIGIPVWESGSSITANRGFAIDKGVSIANLGVNPQQWIYSVDYSTGEWLIYGFTAVSASSTSVSSLVEYRITKLGTKSGTSIPVTYTYRYAKTPSYFNQYNIPWSTLQSYDTIATLVSDYITEGGNWDKLATLTQTGFIYKAKPQRFRSPSECIDVLDHLIYALFPNGFPLEEEHYGVLAMNALEKKRALSNNMLEFLKDVPKWKKLIPSLKNLHSIKRLSGEYLKVKYGILPTISDLKDIVEAVKRQKPYTDKYGFEYFKSGHSAKGSISGLDFELHQNIKIGVDTEDSTFQKLVENLDNVGLLPTFENLWDLVKYSFVIDWFVDVGGLLERVDTQLRMMRYNVRYATMSRKRICRGYSAGSPPFPFVGNIQWEDYHRWVNGLAPFPPLSLHFNQLTGEKLITGSALLIQRKK